jgi:hypothetical protein
VLGIGACAVGLADRLLELRVGALERLGCRLRVLDPSLQLSPGGRDLGGHLVEAGEQPTDLITAAGVETSRVLTPRDRLGLGGERCERRGDAPADRPR